MALLYSTSSSSYKINQTYGTPAGFGNIHSRRSTSVPYASVATVLFCRFSLTTRTYLDHEAPLERRASFMENPTDWTAVGVRSCVVLACM
jgi:hypothetical protein